MSTPGEAPRAVLIDLDDTLLPWNTPSHWQWSWRPQGPKLGDRHVRSALRRSMRAWDRRRWRGLVGAEPPVHSPDRLAHLKETLHRIAGHALPASETDAVVARFDRPAGEIESYDDVLPALRRLSEAGRSIGIVTELPETVAVWALRRAGLSDLRIVAHGDGHVDHRLPAKAGFRAACEALDSPASRTVFIGDLFWSDVRAASRAGLTGVLLDRYDRFGGVEARRIDSLLGAVDVTLGSGPPETPDGPEGPGDSDGPQDAAENLPEGSSRGAPPTTSL